VKLPKNPRRPNGAFSTIIALAPDSSPPTAKPWISLRISSMIGAQMPIAAYDGRKATRSVAPPISSMHRTSTFLRPYLSPQLPR
jgi:hypothetical protein